MVGDIARLSSSLDLTCHPMRLSKARLKADYFTVLEYIVRQCSTESDSINMRLDRYRELLKVGLSFGGTSDKVANTAILSIVNNPIKPWRKRYKYWLLCDLTLILLNSTEVQVAHDKLRTFLTRRQAKLMDKLFDLLFNDGEIPAKFSFAKDLINQFRINRRFLDKPLTRILVTATMSAGKSTLINAIIGKPIAKTSQETCTSNICFIYNKPFEDGCFHLSSLRYYNHNATYDEIKNCNNDVSFYVASYFRSLILPKTRLCLIDTPGVDAALNENHRKMTNKVIAEGKYNKLIYVLDAEKLGTDGEMGHLKYIYENVASEKIVFVVNKLDCFNIPEDSIAESIENVKMRLINIGFVNPLIFPLSSYFSLLLKRSWNNDELNGYEKSKYSQFITQFSLPEYDLGKYSSIDFLKGEKTIDEFSKQGSVSGLYALEITLYGGIDK